MIGLSCSEVTAPLWPEPRSSTQPSTVSNHCLSKFTSEISIILVFHSGFCKSISMFSFHLVSFFWLNPFTGIDFQKDNNFNRWNSPTNRNQPTNQTYLPSKVGLVLGTLGRQGSVGVVEEIERLLQRRGWGGTEVVIATKPGKKTNL